MPYNEVLVDRIRTILAHKNVESKKMFGGIGFLLNGNMLVAVWKDLLIVRLGPQQSEEAMLEPHVHEFDLTGRAMRGWVMVTSEGVANDDQLNRWVRLALRFVNQLPPKGK